MPDRKEFRELAAPEEARAAIERLDLTPDPETVPLEDARGRVLAERIDAAIDVPGFDRSSLDGYALRARDTFGADEADPVALAVVGEVHAGDAPDVEVGEDEAVEISTGAVMPPGADAMVPVERTDERGDGERGDDEREVLVRTSVTPGENVMRAGADVAAGERALGPGTRLTPREIGLLSALGVDEVPVRGAPRVGIVSTGDELVRPGEDLRSEAGEIYDVNSYAIATAVEEAGGEPVVYPHVGDDYEEMERVLIEAAEECDLVLTSGSTSAGAVDVVYRVIEERGELLLHGVAIKPGKPTLIGELGGAAYVGLPGYPVSALSIFRTFVAPAIRDAAGLPEPRTATVDGKMAVAERYAEGRRRLMPVGLVESGPAGDAPDEATGDAGGAVGGDGTDASGGARSETLVYPVDKGSGATTSLVAADGIVTIPADTEQLAEGQRVTVRLFSPDVRPPTLLGVGEDDPAFSRILDRLANPRHLSVGTREGLRRLRNGVPDVAVAAGPVERDVDADELARWRREWGLIVPAGNPDDVEGLADLVDRDLRLVSRTTASGLRRSFDDALADLADERGTARAELADAIDGIERTARAHESPARAVAAGRVDAGLGLRATADSLDLSFVSLGREDVRVLAAPERREKRGVRELEAALAELPALVDGLAGYEPAAEP